MAIAITDTHIAIQCMREAAYDYLTKPFNLDEVKRLRRRLIGSINGKYKKGVFILACSIYKRQF
jgi:DNA-binding NtrC family response regulator